MRARQFELELSGLSFWTRSEIDQCTRQLRQAGLLPVGGRGLNAPDITTEHAALILIGLAAASRASDVQTAVQTYRALPPLSEPYAGAETFAEAMTAILSSFTRPFGVKAVVICTTWPEVAVNFTNQDGERQTIVYGDPSIVHPGPGMRADITFSAATLSQLALLFAKNDEELE